MTGQNDTCNVMVDHSLSRRIEAALYRHPAVVETAAFYVPLADGRQVFTAFVVPENENLTAKSLAEFIATCPDIAPGERPEKFVLVPDIPRTATGKFQKVELIKYVEDSGG